MNRRQFIGVVFGGVFVLQGARKGFSMGFFHKQEEFPFALSDQEWRRRLSPDAYRVLRKEGTEAAFTSPLNHEKRPGIFYCAGCDNPLFGSEQKFDSGTGWPSFWQPISNDAVGLSTDYKIGVPRISVHCDNCGGHLGHVFDDGPRPTGKRYCMNGVCLTFKPE
jgi:peptide-methionine (R)-S-oxide reductase